MAVIVLTGMPGAGKTTIGKILAKKLGKEFVDTDELIVQREKKTIPQIFDEVGEKGFRKIESDVVSDLGTVQNSIISTGGGAVLNPINVEILKENGVIEAFDKGVLGDFNLELIKKCTDARLRAWQNYDNFTADQRFKRLILMLSKAYLKPYVQPL